MFHKKSVFSFLMLLLPFFLTLASANAASSKSCDPNDLFCVPHGLDTDGGDNPGTAGCTVEQADNCTNAPFVDGDICGGASGKELTEQTGPAACTANALLSFRVYNCEDWCEQQTGDPTAQCLTTPVAACGNRMLGYCHCGN